MRFRVSAAVTFLCLVGLIASPSQAALSSVGTSAQSAKAFNPTVLVNRTIYFSANSAVVGPQSRAKLLRLLPTLKKQSKITLTGYVQAGATTRNNKSLSLARAKGVRTFLIRHGVKAKFVLSPGHVPTTKPRAATARRVEISWIIIMEPGYMIRVSQA